MAAGARLARSLLPAAAMAVVACAPRPGPRSAARAADPAADPRATVVAGPARFTVLTPQLVRMEWAADGRFEDKASLVFLNRRLPVPAFRRREEDGWLIIETGSLSLKYRKESGRFTSQNLSVRLEVSGRPVDWTPGRTDSGNLRGTTRALDGVKGASSIEPGLLSRDGWVVLDESARPLFDDSDWPWPMPRPAGDRQDLYFFGYGHDYKGALRDFARLAGPIPMPPRFAFGVWWSRYWAYSDRELRELVREFEIHSVPLDVLVLDMDWHPTFDLRMWDRRQDQSGYKLGWSGYTWNRALFPDPEGFLAWCERRGLRTPLNLHPASGVQPHEEAYPEMARASGIDPATQKYVAFDIANKAFAESYLKLLHHPRERQGVDFWWIDWQQGDETSLPGVTPDWWLSYVHASDMERRGRRPLLLNRWGGLGSHRYPIGFSGDTISDWESLAFQPFFTATAANVLYGYWSHDIGGHQPGPVPPELYTRWIQFGLFSPILRTHATKNPQAERRIWAYPLEHFGAMRDAFLLRYALIPYIYTAAREAYDTGLSLCRPLYYDHPEAEDAYRFGEQYMFGSDLLVAPLAAEMSPETLLATKAVWLPPGEWYEYFTGSRLRGPAVLTRSFALEEVPVYVRAGAVIPMQPAMRRSAERPVDPLILAIFGGESGAARIYEDDGESLGYTRGEAAWTAVRHSRLADGRRLIEVLPVEGSYPGMPRERAYEVRVVGCWPPRQVRLGGRRLPFRREDEAGPGWRYEGDKLTAVITLPRLPRSEKVELFVFPAALPAADEPLLDGVPSRLARLKRAMGILNGSWPKDWSPEVLVEAAETGHRITLRPESAREELAKLERTWPELIEQLRQARPRKLKKLALGHLGAGG